jgi:NAD(P)-dependent dehydrogenase (short-subunit alcohol dehydrogenase family)
MRELLRLALDGAAFAAKFGPWAVIAGASEGTGACYAEELAALGINLLLVSRRPDALEALGERLAAAHGIEFRTLALDLSETGAGTRIVEAAADLDVGLYISNAGADNFASFFEDSVETAPMASASGSWLAAAAGSSSWHRGQDLAGSPIWRSIREPRPSRSISLNHYGRNITSAGSISSASPRR